MPPPPLTTAPLCPMLRKVGAALPPTVGFLKTKEVLGATERGTQRGDQSASGGVCRGAKNRVDNGAVTASAKEPTLALMEQERIVPETTASGRVGSRTDTDGRRTETDRDGH